jgi:hypothetical protein
VFLNFTHHAKFGRNGLASSDTYKYVPNFMNRSFNSFFDVTSQRGTSLISYIFIDAPIEALCYKPEGHGFESR